ncbi:MAG: FtsX-like permease family protein [Oligosphaeraceae bacterium]|nr:FtsX-like permease family protein [Oligosphaeraceae bacterium]
MAEDYSIQSEIPEQRNVSWRITIAVSWNSIRRRFLRSLITLSSVVLAIAFLAYMQISNSIVQALIELNDQRLNVRLQAAGVDIYSAGSTDRMMVLLIILSLLACLVGIVNAMLMSVTERIKEIGTIKCLGALDSFIVRTYLIEAALQGIAGTLLGCAGGLLVSLLVASSNYGLAVWRHLPLPAVLTALVISFLTGAALSIAAAIFPAYMAARKQPVDAMRVEE